MLTGKGRTVKHERERIAGYENMKFFLIFLVVLGHFVENAYSFERGSVKALFFGIYFFHMPAFIFLSGLVHRIDAKINWQRCLSFVLLAYLYKMINTMIVGFGSGEWSFWLLREEQIPWFLFAIAAYPVIAWCLKDISPAFVMVFTILLGCMVGFDRSYKGDILVLKRMLTYLPFYMAGCYLDAAKVMAFLKKWWCRCVSVVFLVAYAGILFTKTDAVYPLRHIVTGKNAYSEWALDHGHFFLRIGCYIGAFLVILALISLIPNRKIPVVTVSGKRTLAVYFWHGPLLRILSLTGAAHAIAALAGNRLYFAGVVAAVITLVFSWEYFTYPIDYVVKGIYRRKGQKR